MNPNGVFTLYLIGTIIYHVASQLLDIQGDTIATTDHFTKREKHLPY